MNHFRLQRHGDLWLEFSGELIGDATSDDGDKERWQHLRLYRTDKGGYILERLGESRIPGEITMRNVDEYAGAGAVRHQLKRKRDDGTKYFTIVALELLDQAAKVDDAFKEATAERI